MEALSQIFKCTNLVKCMHQRCLSVYAQVFQIFVVLSTIVHPFVFFFSLFFLWNPDKLISFGIYVCSVECQIA